MLRCSASWRQLRRRQPPATGVRLQRGALMLSVLIIGACDFPTAPPVLQPRFVLPGESTTMSVTQLLPADVTVAGSNFRLSIAPVQIPARTLAELCGEPCVAAHGQTVPKPAFEATIETTVPLPADVTAAALAAGSVRVSLMHTFGFDPIRPSGSTAPGSLQLTVLSGGREVGSLTTSDAFPSGAPLDRTIQLTPGAVASDMTVRIRIVSPAGGTADADRVQVNSAATLSGVVTPLTIDVSEATVRVQNRQVSVTQAELDLSGVDQSLRGRVRGGAITVVMNNPYGVGGALQLQLIGGGTVTKPLNVQPGQSTQRIEFTEAELQSLLGHNVRLQITGPVSAPSGTVTIRPNQTLTIDTRLELTLEIG
jgi:hypothetical protein